MTEIEPQAPVAEGKTESSTNPAAEELVATEAGLVDIASTLSAPTVTVVRLSL
jgi:hypothetical protein